MRFTLTALLALLMLSCSDASDKEMDVAYFGGEIDNPKNSYLYLKDSDGNRDTIILDSENRFMHKIENLIPGIFEFGHGDEIQVAVIEGGDSIALRLNTKDFDESLVYTGKGARKNNLLMKLFLDHEERRRIIVNHYKKEPEAFQGLIDSIIDLEMEELAVFHEKKETSKLFQSLSEAMVRYNYYYYKERYPFEYFGKNRLIHFDDLPEDFYAYRKNVDLNNSALTELFVFRNYIFMYLNNVSLHEFYKDHDHNLRFNDKSISYNIEKLRLIDSLVQNEDIKSYLMRSVTKEYILESEVPAKMQMLTNAFLELSDDEEVNKDITDYLNSRVNVSPGKKLADVIVVGSEHTEHNLVELIDKPTLIYFWSSNHKLHARNSHRIVKTLKPQYPFLDFISINVNELRPASWEQTLKEYRFETTEEYLFKDPRKGLRYLAASPDNCILVDKDGIILETDFGLFEGEIEKVLFQFNDGIYTYNN